MHVILARWRRTSGAKPPLPLVVGSLLATLLVWLLIYDVAGRPIWLW